MYIINLRICVKISYSIYFRMIFDMAHVTHPLFQEYDEHMGAVNTVTICEDGKRLETQR